MRRIALTGGIATGKSYVRSLFAALGIPTVDSDTLARQAVAVGTPGLAKVVERFGRDVLDATGALERHKLAAIVFSDAAARRDLEAIIHPDVQRATDAWYAALPDHHSFAVADIPLLYEIGRDQDFDKVIVAACDRETQLQRLMKRDGLSQTDARRRIEAQLPIEEKIRRADFVIRTDGSFDDTRRQVAELVNQLAGTR